MTIGDRIRRRRIELGMSQEELAHRLGYKSRSSINKIEIGWQNLKQKKIKAIADALQTTPEYIMGWDEKGPAEKNTVSIDKDALRKIFEEDRSKLEAMYQYIEELLSEKVEKDGGD